MNDTHMSYSKQANKPFTIIVNGLKHQITLNNQITRKNESKQARNELA